MQPSSLTRRRAVARSFRAAITSALAVEIAILFSRQGLLIVCITDFILNYTALHSISSTNIHPMFPKILFYNNFTLLVNGLISELFVFCSEMLRVAQVNQGRVYLVELEVFLVKRAEFYVKKSRFFLHTKLYHFAPFYGREQAFFTKWILY